MCEYLALQRALQTRSTSGFPLSFPPSHAAAVFVYYKRLMASLLGLLEAW